jgi:hypothetical protein
VFAHIFLIELRHERKVVEAFEELFQGIDFLVVMDGHHYLGNSLNESLHVWLTLLLVPQWIGGQVKITYFSANRALENSFIVIL